nr:putative reverse transcriptase domain-containing protein [Tanacetum cinerariifolium]
MAEENLPAPTRSDEKLKTNFFRAFSALANVPSIYIHQFLNTLTHEAKTGVYSPVDPANPFVSPPAGEIVIGFMNKLGYPEAIYFVSHMHVNNLYQPWRAIMSLINQCLIGKNLENGKPRHSVLQMLCGIVTKTNVDYAELLWEEFVQGIQTFFTHRDSNKIPSKKLTSYVIPYCRFTKLIIYYLGSKYDIHTRPESPRHVMGDDFLFGNLKFVPKDVQVPLDEVEIDENLRFVRESVKIVKRDVKKLKRRRIPLVKVRWNSRQGAEYTWEREDQFRMKYPHLFTELVPSSSVET